MSDQHSDESPSDESDKDMMVGLGSQVGKDTFYTKDQKNENIDDSKVAMKPPKIDPINDVNRLSEQFGKNQF